MTTRRRFMRNMAVGSAAVTLPGWLPRQLQSVALADTQLGSGHVQFAPDIEPTVRLLEETPRDRVLEEFGSRIKRGKLSYRQVVAALMLAGIRNVQPRPSVGHKFHTVLVVNSAHLASINSPAAERWLPIFWALDYFKYAQADDVQQGDWTMPAVDDGKLPPLRKAKKEFELAMDQWDVEKADVAITSLARGAAENELFDLMANYGCRDFRDIGHKTIYVANAFRTLGCIGWRHAEPILRSLTYALLCHSGDPNPSTVDLPADRPERANRELLASTRQDWFDGQLESEATTRLNEILYDCDQQQAARTVSETLNAGVSPQSIYDGLYVTAGELLMRQPGIVALHAVTSTNALGYAFRRVSDPNLRLKLMLQNASFLAMFLGRMKNGQMADRRVGEINSAGPAGEIATEVDWIIERIGRDNDEAASHTLGLLNRDPAAANALIDAARRMVFLKGTNAHDYKFSSAVLEDYYHITPAWRNRYLATATYNFRGSSGADTELLPRIRKALV